MGNGYDPKQGQEEGGEMGLGVAPRHSPQVTPRSVGPAHIWVWPCFLTSWFFRKNVPPCFHLKKHFKMKY